MANELDRRNARQRPAGLEDWQPGTVMLGLWFRGMVLVLSLAVTLHLLAMVLRDLWP